MTKKISEYERVARRRIRYISPLNAGKVLGNGRYWTLPFLRLYLDECDEKIFNEPEDGYLLAQHAPELARRIEIDDVPGDGGGARDVFASELEKRSWRVRALATWGSSCRAYGELTQAEAAYRLAFELHEQGVDEESAGELFLRAAVLAFARHEGASEELVNRAIDHFSTCACREKLADALVVRGAIRIKESDPAGLVDSAKVLQMVDFGSRRSQRTMISALHNMAIAATRGTSSIQSQEIAHRLLQEVKRRLASKPRSLAKMRVYWVEGLLLAKMGITRLAQRRLARVRDGLCQLGEPFAFTLASLDLAAILASDGHLESASSLAQETTRTVGEMSDDAALRAALDEWCRARVVSVGFLYRLKDRVAEAAPGRGEPRLERAMLTS